MTSLFLVALLQSLPKTTEAGTQFSSCLGVTFTNAYDQIVAFGKNVADRERFCCTGYASCASMPKSCPQTYYNTAQCSKVGQTKFCVTVFVGLSLTPSILCGGILGETSPTNFVIGNNCPSLDVVGNALSVGTTSPNFSWMCCNLSSCYVPINVVRNGLTANTNCSVDQYSLMCFNDNGGWSCTGSIGDDISDISMPFGDCVLQISNNSISSGNYGDYGTAKTNHIVPIAVGTGVGVVGVGSLGGLIYYLTKTGHLKSLLKIIKPKITIQRQESRNNVNLEIELSDLGGTEETFEQSEEQSSEKEKKLPIPPIKVHLASSSAGVKNNPVEQQNQQKLSYQQLIEQVKLRLDPEGQEFLYNFVDAQDMFYNANEKTKASAERQLKRAKTSLGTKIS